MMSIHFQSSRSHTASRGFTLIELMIVVVIIGVLSALAVYGVTNYIRTTKTAEAREVVGQIMSAQEAFFDETGAYLDVTGGITDNDFYPKATFSGDTLVQWGADDGCQGEDLSGTARPCGALFRQLGVMVNSPVRFRYATTTLAADAAPTVPTSYVTQFNPDGVKSRKAGYLAVALSDLDGNTADRSAVVGSSMQAQLYVENLGK